MILKSVVGTSCLNRISFQKLFCRTGGLQGHVGRVGRVPTTRNSCTHSISQALFDRISLFQPPEKPPAWFPFPSYRDLTLAPRQKPMTFTVTMTTTKTQTELNQRT